MKIIFLLLIVAALFAACPAPDGNQPENTNTNANTNEPAAAAPTAETFMALDKQANEAYFKADSKFFEDFVSDKFVMFDNGKRTDKAAALKMIASGKCDIKEGWKLEDPQMSMIDADTYAFSYKGTFDGTCTGPDGKSMKVPSPVRAATIYVRNGDKWQAAYHAENLIVDPKNPPAAAPAAEKKEPAKEEAKKEEPKKEEAKKEEPKKEEPAAAKSEEAKEPAKPAGDENTAALVKIHTSGWEAFKAKDAKKFEEIISDKLAIVDPLGGWISGKAAVIKQWTETMKCEGITKVAVTDGVATALSPTVELLTLKGNADGTCNGQKNGDLYQTAVYVKEGDAWKLAFMFESPAM